MLNKVILIGNVGKDPEIRKFDNGGMVAQFTLATTERGFKTKDGKEIPEKTEWHNIVVYGSLAGVVEQYVKSGHRLCIEGKLKTRSYEQNGVKHYITEIYSNNIVMLTPKKDAKGESNYSPIAPPPEEDDLPF